MIRGIDHLVIAVKDLEAASRAYGELGFTVVPGGRHPVGTYNTLIAFADGSYVELIGFYRDNPDHRWWSALQRGGGLVDYCLQTDDLYGRHARLPRRGRGHRRSGVPVARAAGRLSAPLGVLALPPARIAAWDPSSSMTRRRARRVPREQTHPNGVTGIGAVRIATGDLAAVSGWYTKATGQPGTAITSAEAGGAGTRFMAGPHALEFLAPAQPGGALAQWLGQRGASPYDATLTTRSGKTGPLDTKHTMGARLSLIGA